MTNPIPTDWKRETLKKLNIAVLDGDRGKNYPKQDDFSPEGYCLFLNAGNVTKKGFSFSDVKFVSKERDELLRKGKLQKGDLVVTTRGTIGQFAYYGKNVPYENIRINSGMAIIRNENEEINTNFLFSYFRSPLFIREIKRLSFGSAQPQLTIQILNKLSPPVPPLPEQHRITAVLETWDKSLEYLARKIKLKKNIKKGLMQELLTGKRRLKGFGEKWRTIKLGDICKIGDGNHSSKYPRNSEFIDSGVPFIRGTNIVDGIVVDNGMRYISNEKHKTLKKGHLAFGDIIVVNRGEIGKVGFVPQEFHNSNLNSQLAWLRVGDSANNLFIFYALNSSRSQSFFKNNKSGGALQQLPLKILAELVINLPSKEEQTAIAKILTTADDEITLLEKKKQILEDQKKYLLNNLITGQIRTPENLTMPNHAS